LLGKTLVVTGGNSNGPRWAAYEAAINAAPEGIGLPGAKILDFRPASHHRPWNSQVSFHATGIIRGEANPSEKKHLRLVAELTAGYICMRTRASHWSLPRLRSSRAKTVGPAFVVSLGIEVLYVPSRKKVCE
jgi:hypothetical protein